MSSSTATDPGEKGWFIAACVALSVFSFAAGIGPAYRFELDQNLDASERCPEGTPTEGGYDRACVERLIEHGPLYLGKEALALSFASGLAGIITLFAAADRRWTRRVATLGLVFAVVLFGSAALGDAAGVRSLLVFFSMWVIGWVTIASVRMPAGRAEMILLLLYLATWAALLLWNDAEGERLARNGTGIAG
jgi:hypothetical protein